MPCRSANSETYYFPPLDKIATAFRETWLFDRVGSDVVPSLVRLGLGYLIDLPPEDGASIDRTDH